jgi:hypothetical protein
MKSRVRIRAWILEMVVVVAVVAAAGCREEGRASGVARNRVAVPPTEVKRVMRPLSVAPDADPSPMTAMAPAPGVTLEARLLVITADGSDPAFDAIQDTLGYLGTPYDVLDASKGPALTAATLADGDRGRYYGIVLDTGDLAAGNLSAFSQDEWMTLASYEARFGVRRAVMYAYPTEAYGLTSTGGFDVSMAPFTAHCTDAGRSVFVGANCDVPVAIDDGWAYGSQAMDAATVPLLVDGAGTVYAATRSYPDGREALVLTFAQSPTVLHTLELAYGVVDWVTRGLFVGERHVYLSPQIDDLFLASDIFTGGTYRITDADLQAFSDWQTARRADPLTADFRAAFAFNAFGAKPPGRDGLTDKALALGPTFAWINHTWDHTEMDAMAYADAFEEFSLNNQYGLGSGLSRYSVTNLVTPSISGLGNAEVMRAAYDVGIRQLVSDTSVACEANPTPNTGYYNALVPQLLQIPRRPTDLYFNVSQPAEWVAEYQKIRSLTLTVDQIVDAESLDQVRYMLRGESDPWMFHQANLRDLGGGQSLITAFLDAVLAKYAARATFPVVSPTMDELAAKVKARMALDAAGVSAVIAPGTSLTITAAKAATVPVTGLCTPAAETYGGRQISYLQLQAGQSITVSLADCNPDLVAPGGTGGADDGEGTPTMGGNCPASGSGGTGGSTGAGGAGGDTGVAGDMGSGGSGASSGGTTGALTTDAGTGPDTNTGCSCVVSRGGAGGGAGAVLFAFALGFAAGARARRVRPAARCARACAADPSGRTGAPRRADRRSRRAP